MIIIGIILSFILFISVLILIEGRHWTITRFWLIFRMPISTLIIVSIFDEAGIRLD